MKNIVFVTNLKVWSISKGVGAPSFYNTLKLYNDRKHSVTLYTSEKEPPIEELENVMVRRLPKLPLINLPVIFTLNRIINYVVNQFIFLGVVIFHKEKIDLLYGYEIEFIPVLKLISKFKKIKFVSRFQGTILYPLMKKRFWKIRYLPHYLSLKLKSDLTIMTDDGTRGDAVLNALRGDSCNIAFFKNGVNFINPNELQGSDKVSEYFDVVDNVENIFISVSRLQQWKRIDRSIDVFQRFHERYPSSAYIIVGEGPSMGYLKEYVKKRGLADSIHFYGGGSPEDVNTLLFRADVFLSHYELSNVGNPLWEALNANCLIVTISNGSTGEIIKDGCNGIISSEKNFLLNAEKVINLYNAGQIKQLVDKNKDTLSSHVVSWDSRLQQEYSIVKSLN